MAEFDVPKITESVLAEIDRKSAQAGSYTKLVPPGAKDRVLAMAMENYPVFAEKFDGDFRAFAERFSKDWLAKHHTFDAIAIELGYRPIDQLGGKSVLNESDMALLTLSSSYVLIGPGAYDPEGEGASYSYTKVPLRVAFAPEDISAANGLILSSVPVVGERFRLGRILTTSSLVLAFYKLQKLEEGIRPIGHEMMSQAFTSISRTVLPE